AAVHGRHDFAAGQRVYCCTHTAEDVDRQTHSAELEAAQVFGFRDRLLEPTERLGGHRAVHEGDDVEVEALVDLLQQLLAAAVLVPGEEHVRIHAEGRPRTPQRHGGVLAVPVRDHAVAAVQGPLADR